MYDCENCLYGDYDDETDSIECTFSIDEDDYRRWLVQKPETCPFFRYNNEYKIVNRQI